MLAKVFILVGRRSRPVNSRNQNHFISKKEGFTLNQSNFYMIITTGKVRLAVHYTVYKGLAVYLLLSVDT